MTNLPKDVQSALGPVLLEYGLTSATVATASQTILVTAPVPTPLPLGFDYGFNIGGSWATASAINDPNLYLPQLMTDIASLGTGRYVRAWQTGSIQTAPADSQFTQTRLWAAQGLKPVAVFNTQNNNPRCMAPTTSQLQAYFNGVPSAANTGIYAWELVNEADYTAYYADTDANLANIFAVATPILKSKGYKVIATNALSSVGYYQDSKVTSVIKSAGVDFIGRHGYQATAVLALQDYVKVKAVADQLGVGFFCTEVGLTGNPAPFAELQKLWAGLPAIGGVYLGFTLYQVSTASSYQYQCQPYTSPGVKNAANFNAIVSGLAAA